MKIKRDNGLLVGVIVVAILCVGFVMVGLTLPIPNCYPAIFLSVVAAFTDGLLVASYLLTGKYEQE